MSTAHALLLGLAAGLLLAPAAYQFGRWLEGRLRGRRADDLADALRRRISRYTDPGQR